MKLLEELKSIVLIVAVIFCLRSSLINWYVVPTGSMLPSIKIGDRTVVNKLSYGFMLPFMETRIYSWDTPQRGDIVVFKGPDTEQGLTLIKRVVGVGGDVVKFTAGVLTINGVAAKEVLQSDRSILNDIEPDQVDYKYLLLESGYSKEPHYILRKRFGGATNNETRTWVVPPNKLLLMGDNRDDSRDGRSWGFMDEDRIYGRAFLISYSTSNYHQKTLIPEFRADRWFMLLSN